MIPDRFPAQDVLLDPDDLLDFAVAGESAVPRPGRSRDLFVLCEALPEGKRAERTDAGRDFLDLAAVSAADWTAALADRPVGDSDAVVILAEDPARRS